jgi:hypothetical protein
MLVEEVGCRESYTNMRIVAATRLTLESIIHKEGDVFSNARAF